MNAQQIAQLVIAAVLSAPAAALITQVLKRHPLVPVESGQRAKLLAVNAVISAAGVVIGAVAQGTLSAPDLQQLLAAGVACVAAFIGSQMTYTAAKE